MGLISIGTPHPIQRIQTALRLITQRTIARRQAQLIFKILQLRARLL